MEETAGIGEIFDIVDFFVIRTMKIHPIQAVPSKFSLAEGEQEDEDTRLNSHFFHQAVETIKGLWSVSLFGVL